MKNRNSIVVIFICLLLFSSCSLDSKSKSENTEENFSFVFMTDIHLQPERNAVEGFMQAIDSVNTINPDFVITGGDLIMDALGQDFNRADSLYNLYDKITERLIMPVYNTIGNHEIFGIYDKSDVDKSHPEYGEMMFEKRLGQRYYSFDHKGWHFMILDGIEDTGESSYIGKVDSLQMKWIITDLEKIDKQTPIAISVHIPFVTSYMQVLYGSTVANGDNLVVTNAKDVLDLFEGFNLKLVLQGHLHFLEDIYVQGTHFITGGAVSSKWWSGKEYGMEEGFLVIHVEGDEFSWEYFDYGWEVEK